MNTHRALSAIFAEKFGLQPREASVLGALYLNRERPTGPVSLAEQAGASPTAIHHHLSCLRNDLAPEPIERVRRDGYRLSEAGRAKCRLVVEETRTALEAA